MAERTGSTLAAVLGYGRTCLTNRQRLAWRAYMRADMDQPSRADFYVMRLIAAVEGILSTKVPDVNEYRITFKPVAQVVRTPSKASAYEEAMRRVRASQAVWSGVLGFDIPQEGTLPVAADEEGYGG